MTIFDRVKALADKQGKSIVDVEADLGMSKNYLYKWKKAKPTAERLEQVADYFNVSTDYILGRTPTPSFTAKDEIDVQKAVTNLIQGLSNKDSLAFLKNNGEELDEEDAELLRSSLENVARQSLLLSKKRSQKSNDKK
ncbi:transcriptional regulator [Levilactobacillus zymae]|uniref:Transcriptional regulator n=1 Tax=Levilactobacillus zymae TaxID=267363 RepID=A0ABQ0WZ68_9LACO|nr:helix-turn-helix domain-containing protein [Levilactobacillus zymae]QFR61048.1 helix-turn-helix domain-containing protein [Levilactobacillus zymae]GEO73214.1 transcriptional regulator [Levilactobacillus zymae]